MLFKNARIYRFTRPVDVTPEQLEVALSSEAFKPCGPQEASRQGWAAPMGKLSEQLVHTANGYMLICLQRQEKVLPAPVVADFVAERCEAIEHDQNRKVRRKERDEIKEQVVQEMLPQAFPRNKKVYAYLSVIEGCVVIDAGTARAAEDLLSMLRKTLGSLPVRPVVVKQHPAFTLTGWLSDAIEAPDAVTVGTDCWLEDPSQDGGKVTVRSVDLKGDEVRSHLEAGMQVTRLAMTWDDNVSFTLDEDLGMTRLKFGEGLLEKLDDVDADDAPARFDAAFCLMTLELSRLIPALLGALGGEDRSAVVEDGAVLMGVDMAQPGADRTVKITVPPTMYTDDRDPLYLESAQLVTVTRRATISSIQRVLKIGYNRAAHLMDALEENGVVSEANHNGMREVLAPEPAAATA